MGQAQVVVQLPAWPGCLVSAYVMGAGEAGLSCVGILYSCPMTYFGIGQSRNIKFYIKAHDDEIKFSHASVNKLRDRPNIFVKLNQRIRKAGINLKGAFTFNFFFCDYVFGLLVMFSNDWNINHMKLNE